MAMSGRVGQRREEGGGRRDSEFFPTSKTQLHLRMLRAVVHPSVPSGNDSLLLPTNIGVVHDRTRDYALETWVRDARIMTDRNILCRKYRGK